MAPEVLTEPLRETCREARAERWDTEMGTQRARAPLRVAGGTGAV